MTPNDIHAFQVARLERALKDAQSRIAILELELEMAHDTIEAIEDDIHYMDDEEAEIQAIWEKHGCPTVPMFAVVPNKVAEKLPNTY